MTKLTASAVLSLLLLLALALSADNVCPCVPLSHEWVATACETWNCAQSAMILANGDPYVVAVPTGNDTWKWVVLKRVVSGSLVISPDAPFNVEQFDGMPQASARFGALEPDAHAMLMTVVDGKALVISLRPEARRRAVGR